MKYILAHPEARRRAQEGVQKAADGDVVTIKPPTRTAEQNAALWPYLEGFAKTLEWPINGRMTRIEPEDWKDILSAAWKRETTRVALGLDGGMVMLGLRTSRMGKREFSEFLDFVAATAVSRGVEVYP